MNLMPYLAMKLGVEMGEKFLVVCGKKKICYAKFLHVELSLDPLENKSETPWGEDVLFGLVVGNYQVQKILAPPDEGDKYYAVSLDECLHNGKWENVIVTHYVNHILDYLNVRIGNIFKTYDEAKKAVPDILPKLEKFRDDAERGVPLELD